MALLKPHYLEIVEIINGSCLDCSKAILVRVYVPPGVRKRGRSVVLLETEVWFQTDVGYGTSEFPYLLSNIVLVVSYTFFSQNT